MGVNKVEFGGNTLVDLTNDDVTAGDVRSGVYFTDRSGTRSAGTMVVEGNPIKIKTYTTPSITVAANGSTWVYSLDLHPTAISGYTPVGMFNPTPNNQSSLICQMCLNKEAYGDRFAGVIRNVSSSQLSDTFAIPVMYVKTDLL